MTSSDRRKTPGTPPDRSQQGRQGGSPDKVPDEASSNPLSRALELARAGQWHDAHRLVQGNADPLSCAIHAYLHRVEGDEANAHYWYRRAGRQPVTLSLDEEWQTLAAQVESSTV